MSRFLISGFKLIIGLGSLIVGVLVYFQAGLFIGVATSLVTNPDIALANEDALLEGIKTFDDIRSNSIILIILGLVLIAETTLRAFISNMKPGESRKDYGR